MDRRQSVLFVAPSHVKQWLDAAAVAWSDRDPDELVEQVTPISSGLLPWPDNADSRLAHGAYADRDRHDTPMMSSGVRKRSRSGTPADVVYPSPGSSRRASLASIQRLRRRQHSYDATRASRRSLRMQTGCIPCLIKGVACDPRNPTCRRASSRDWFVNPDEYREADAAISQQLACGTLEDFRPNLTWRRNWRERNALNFFVTFTAPQMGGFFESNFWSRTVVRATYTDPAIMHAVAAIGSLHEAIMQRAFTDEKRKAQAMEFALLQCNRSISLLVEGPQGDGASEWDSTGRMHKSRRTFDPRTLLIACVLFTCFESMQGHSESAVRHALQGQQLLSNTHTPSQLPTHPDDDSIEDTRLLIDRLEAQAVSLVDKSKRASTDTTSTLSPLHVVEEIESINQAQHTLHHCMNTMVRFLQAVHPSGPKDHVAMTMAEKNLLFTPWLQKWHQVFLDFLSRNMDSFSDLDLKRCLVLKCNHMMFWIMSFADQSLGASAYDGFDEEFQAIVEWSREVLKTFSCPPLPTLKPGSSAAPYLSFSLWVTDPLWMVISRCPDPKLRRSAFSLLSQHPRQEGIWHHGPSSQAIPEDKPVSVRRASSVAGSDTDRLASIKTVVKAANKIEAHSSTEVASPSTISERSSVGRVEENYEIGPQQIRGELMDIKEEDDLGQQRLDLEQMILKSRFQPSRVWPTSITPETTTNQTLDPPSPTGGIDTLIDLG